MWSASGGLMALQSLSVADKVRQARALDEILEGFSTSDEDDDGYDDDAAAAMSSFEANFAGTLSLTAKAAAKAAVGNPYASIRSRRNHSPSGSSSSNGTDDAASVASTRLESACSSSSVPSTSGGSSSVSYAESAPPSTGCSMSSMISAAASSVGSSVGSVGSGGGSSVCSSSSYAGSTRSAPGSLQSTRPLVPHRPPAPRSSMPSLPRLPSLRDEGASIESIEEEAEGEADDDCEPRRGRPRSAMRWRLQSSNRPASSGLRAAAPRALPLAASAGSRGGSSELSAAYGY